MILTDDNISRSKIIKTSYFVFKLTNICLLIEEYYFCSNNRTLRFKNNMIEYIKTNKYSYQILL